LNRRPADYETIQSSQIAENTVHRPSFAPASEPVAAQVEQVSEQVDAHQASRERRRSGLQRAGSILQDRFPEFHVSRRRLRQAESIQLVRDRRNAANQQLGFASRPFVLCGLPVRCPPSSTLVYERRNGLFTLQITGHPDFGLPFGQDRLVLLPIFLATLAVRQQSQTIRFRSAAQMLETFGMAKGGKEYRRLVAAFERIFGATIFFGTESTRRQARVIQRSRFNFLSEAKIWYNRDPDQEVLSAGIENVIVLSDEFYKEVIAHPIPADIEAVKCSVLRQRYSICSCG
jgi:hypothetical protein